VNKSRKWADLGRLLGYTGIPGLSTQLKNAYTRVILPYEEFSKHVKTSPALSQVTPAREVVPLRTQTRRATPTSASEVDDAISDLSDLDEPKPLPLRTRRMGRGSSSARKQFFSPLIIARDLNQIAANGQKPVSQASPQVSKSSTTRTNKVRDSDEDSSEVLHNRM
jgi:hypothetical protein